MASFGFPCKKKATKSRDLHKYELEYSGRFCIIRITHSVTFRPRQTEYAFWAILITLIYSI